MGAILFETRKMLKQMIRGSDVVIIAKAYHNLTIMRWRADTACHEFKAKFDNYIAEIEELGNLLQKPFFLSAG